MLCYVIYIHQRAAQIDSRMSVLNAVCELPGDCMVQVRREGVGGKVFPRRLGVPPSFNKSYKTDNK